MQRRRSDSAHFVSPGFRPQSRFHETFQGREIMGKNIELTASDGHKFSAYVAEPSGKPKGALIVVMEIFGVNSHIKRVTDEYAADGYLAIAPAFFDRVERGLDVGYTPPDIERARGLMQKMNFNDAVK